MQMVSCPALAFSENNTLNARKIGRGMRLSPSTGKTDCLLVDFADSSKRIADLMSLPTLLGIDAWEMDCSSTPARAALLCDN
jgi:ATP-dependent helicase IRC3